MDILDKLFLLSRLYNYGYYHEMRTTDNNDYFDTLVDNHLLVLTPKGYAVNGKIINAVLNAVAYAVDGDLVSAHATLSWAVQEIENDYPTSVQS
ncbi:MAG: hypothetical protein GYA36_17420 [Veillonellaceae bacterium]|nr:hypothetical protein [Veillonellaceae bacterium]